MISERKRKFYQLEFDRHGKSFRSMKREEEKGRRREEKKKIIDVFSMRTQWRRNNEEMKNIRKIRFQFEKIPFPKGNQSELSFCYTEKETNKRED